MIAVLFSPKHALAQSFSLDVRNLLLNPGERIVSFDLKIASGYVSIVKAPPRWEIHVDNDPSQNVEVSGSILVGAAALHSDDLNGMISITEIPNPGQSFRLTGNIGVTKDFEQTRILVLSPQNVLLESIK
jgi:hypothetical protein